MSETVLIQLRFKEDTVVGEYNDALYFTQEEFATTTKGDIEAMKQVRIDKWVNAVQNPPTPVEPTKEELEELEAQLLKQLEEVQAQIVAKTPPPPPEPVEEVIP